MCNWAIVNAARFLDERSWTVEEAASYLERWALRAPDIASRMASYVADPATRAYVVTYLAGQELCESFLDSDTRGFVRLVTEQLRVSEFGDSPRGGVLIGR